MVVSNNEYISSPTAVALGFFDGLHLGHASLIEKACSLSDENIKSLVYTFDKHPSVFFGKQIPAITSFEKKISLIQEYNIDYIYVENITEEFLGLSPESFVSEILKKKLNARYVISGENYTFGENKSGNSSLLKTLCEKYDIEYILMPFKMYDDKIISSSSIRELILKGNISDANKMLGRPFSVSGEVVCCRMVGRSIGFPTANIYPNLSELLPFAGVYATNTILEGKCFPSITNVGNAPTFNEENVLIETHLLDFDRDIYSKNITIEFLSFLRNQQKFSSPSELSEQLKKDIETRRKLWKV